MPSRQPWPEDAAYASDYTESSTTLDPGVLDDRAFAFTAQLYLPGVRRYWAANAEGHSITGLHAPDGSWAEVREPSIDGTRYLEQGGHRALWSCLEEARGFWESAGKPD